MGRRRKPPADARALDGWLVVDKPEGVSSAGAVARLRRALRPRRIGHAGTLDPLATGVLPVALGEATKTVGYAMEGEKSYRFAIRFGESRATDDAEGEVTATSGVRPAAAEVAAVLPRFTGTIEQVPPAYSALKVEGRRAYARARAGERVDLEPRRVAVHGLRMLGWPDAATVELEVDCGKGLYVRALARDIAAALGALGYVSELRRTRVGPFREDQAIPLAKLCVMGHSAPAFAPLYPVATVLDDIPALAVSGTEAARLRHGQAVSGRGTGSPGLPKTERDFDPAEVSEGSVVSVFEGDRLVALARWHAGTIRPVRVLNLGHGEDDVDYR